MEKRSRRRIRDLVALAAFQGLSQNEIGCARISMMARSTNAPFKGRIQKRKTYHLQIITYGLQRAAGPYKAMKRREQVQRNCQCASTSRQKTHQAKADRAPRFRQCLIIARRSSTCRVELHWHLGPGADHGRMAGIAEAWDRSTAPGATSRSTISSASVRLQRLRLACRSGAQLIPILVMAGPVLAMHVFGQIYSIHFERGPPCQKKRSRRRNRKPN